jgi:NAD(P)-dependent dehydrogenase (short-subunit alcohol dehydrogenase family)
MIFSLASKIAVVTGGGKGIGQAISSLFSKQGARVFVLDLDQEAGETTVAAIRTRNGNAEWKSCDVSSQKSVDDVMGAIAVKTKTIDILVNNAGIAHIGNAENTSEEDFDRIFSVNVKGVYNCARAAIPFMKQKGGVILNMASIASVTGLADRFAYTMSKGAVYSMTMSIAKDFMKEKIRCNAIAPARVHTPFLDGFLKKNYPGREEEMFATLSKAQPIGRMGKAEEIAALALYLCSDEASFVTGNLYPIDGGYLNVH